MKETLKEKRLFHYARYVWLGIGCFWCMETNRKAIAKTLYKIYCNLILMVMITIPMMLWAKVPGLLLRSNVPVACVTIAESIYATEVVMKSLYVRSNLGMKTIKTAIVNDEEIFSSEDTATRKIYIDQIYSCHKLIITIAIVCSGFLNCVFCTSGAIRSILETELVKNDPTFKRTEVLDFWYPLNIELKERYHIWLTLHQICCTVICHMQLLSSVCINNCLMTYFRARLRMLQWRFRNIANPNTIRQLYQEHNNLIMEIETYNKGNSGIALLDFILFATSLGVSIYPITEGVDVVRSAICPITCIAQILLYTTNADDVLCESLALSDALYESTWYEERNCKYVKNVLNLMIMRCQKPLCITMGSFGPLTAYTGLQQIKMAYSYLSVLTSK